MHDNPGHAGAAEASGVARRPQIDGFVESAVCVGIITRGGPPGYRSARMALLLTNGTVAMGIPARLDEFTRDDRAAAPSVSGDAEQVRLLGGRIPWLVVPFFAMNLALGAAFLFVSALDLPYGKLNGFFNLEAERNLPTWYSTLQLFVLAVMTGLFAASRFDRTQPRSWFLWGLTLVFLAMSMDEIAEIHEYLGYESDVLLPGGDRKQTPFGYTGIWMFLIGVPFLLFALGLVMSVRRYFAAAPGVLKKFIVGFLVLVGGASGVETAANFVVLGSAWHVVQVFFEETMEMTGVTIMLWGAYDLVRASGFVISRNAAAVPVVSPSERRGRTG